MRDFAAILLNGLRDYKIEPSIWGGDSKCKHQWKSTKTIKSSPQKDNAAGGGVKGSHTRGNEDSARRTEFEVSTGEFCAKCSAWRGVFGLEPNVEMYVEHSVEIFKAVWRVLRDDGTFWINLGDSYVSQGGTGQNRHWDGREKNTETQSFRRRPGSARADGIVSDKSPRNRDGISCADLKSKDLIGVPWHVAFALQKAGWYLRQDIIWSKPNPMPESVTDRCSKSHEYIFMLTKKPQYYFDHVAIAEPSKFSNGKAADFARETKDHLIPNQSTVQHRLERESTYNTGIRNKRSVWEVAAHPFPEAHFATFPPKLIEPCIRAGTSSKGCCAKCGAPWIRKIEKGELQGRTKNDGAGYVLPKGQHHDRKQKQRNESGWMPNHRKEKKTTGWEPSCNCNAKAIPCTVLDPFGGSGTTGMVCSKLERDAILIEISPQYAEMARRRAGQRFAEIWNVEDD